MAGAGEKDKYNKDNNMGRTFRTVPRKKAASPKRKTNPVKPGLIAGAIPKLTPKAMPKKKATGGPTSKPKPGGMTGKPRKPAMPNATPKDRPKLTPEQRRARAKAGNKAQDKKAAMPMFSAKMNQANPGKGMSAGTFAKKVVMNFPPVALAAAGVKARLASVKKNEKFKMDTAKNSKPKSTAAKNKTMAFKTPKISKKGM